MLSQDLHMLSSLMQEAYLCREQMDVYKAIKTRLSKLRNQACDEKFVTAVLTDYNAARTINPCKRCELTMFLNSKQAEFDAYADTFRANMQTLLKTGFSSHGEDAVVISGISKCAYYMTDYRFPIYDSFAHDTLNTLAQRLGMRSINGDKKYEKYYATYSELLGRVRDIASDKNRNLIDEMDSLLWLFGMMERYQDNEYLSTDWGNLQCAASWNKKMQDWMSK